MLRRIYYRFSRNKRRMKKYSYKSQIDNRFAYSYKWRRRNRFIPKKLGAAVIMISVIVLFTLIMLSPHLIRNTYIVTVTNKQKITRENTDKFLIYTQTEQGEIRIFENTNNFLEMKFNSEDLYSALSINKKYEIVAYGFSIPILLHYQNIAKIKGIYN